MAGRRGTSGNRLGDVTQDAYNAIAAIIAVGIVRWWLGVDDRRRQARANAPLIAPAAVIGTYWSPAGPSRATRAGRAWGRFRRGLRRVTPGA